MKTIAKIRKMLGNRYHLSVESDGTGIIQWVLFKYYENGDPIYWSDDNKPIMRSGKNTIEELYEFAKSHRKPDPIRSFIRFNNIIMLIVCVIAFANCFVNSTILRTIIFTTDAIIVASDIYILIINEKTHKLNMRELNENWVKRMSNLFPEDKETK